MSDQPKGDHEREFWLTAETRRLLDRPDTERSAYSDRTAWLMSQLADISYICFEDSDEEKTRLRAEAAKAGFEIAEFFNETIVCVAEKERETGLKDNAVTDTQALLLVSAARNQAVLAFRGSEPNKTDWLLTDADAVFVNLDAAANGDGLAERVHRGFYESYVAVRDQIIAAVAARVPPGMPLFVTGHSLGGALASIAACELEKSRRLAAVYTFGAPRVGNPAWAALTKVPVYRVVNNRDAVPLLLFGTIIGDVLSHMGLGRLVTWIRNRTVGFIGFQHWGDLRFLTAEGALKIGSDATISRLLTVYFDIVWVVLRRRWARLVRTGMSFGTDHFMSGYIAKLEKIALARNPAATDERAGLGPAPTPGQQPQGRV